MGNIYYNPEEFGLTAFGELHFRYESYEFDFAAIWKTENNKFYVATDSGCSCPSPFEWAESVNDLTGPLDRAELIDWITELEAPEYSPNPHFQTDKVRLIERLLDL